ncbi:MAG TPA: spore cortex-lytic enzyme [Candidatus Pullichristensenella stercorigallinarum]|uniref:Spore cortex-lytic enzyme n=1 Tax=Candidatus Pullichristensenella stercorigallinarum TaxID=2840909 RepID=A0A9D0ZLL8_9FIRM|nr:spore cortex-lytic enzyme [Candidatus Pullichristensenella stercorigallinarum]
MNVGKRILILVLALLLVMPSSYSAVVLEVGSSGENVRKVQQRLIQYDYLSGEADGKYGEQTRDAVMLFQRRNGLTVDGRVGPDTAAALGVTLSSSGSSSSSSSATIISADHRLLSKLVYAEARGESYKGQVAVAAVVLNRVESSSFPNTISGVIYQSGAFSCVSNGSINNTPDSTAIRAALDALNGWDPTGGCLYYYNPSATSDEWIRTRTVKTVIGNHYFAV